jgi:hypothetical protein
MIGSDAHKRRPCRRRQTTPLGVTPDAGSKNGEITMPKKNDFSLEWDAPKAGVYDARVTNIEIIYSEPRAVRISYQTESTQSTVSANTCP